MPNEINWANRFRILGLLVEKYNFIQILKVHPVSNIVEPGLALHCLPITHKKASRLMLVNDVAYLLVLMIRCF